MTVLLQVSDTHFGTEQAAVVNALLALAEREQASVQVLSGDITQRARRAQFDAARAFVQRLPPARRVIIPGNHDIPLYDVATRAFAPYRHFRRVFGDVLEPEVETPDMLVIGVKTTRRWRHKHGVVSRTQVERVAARLKTADPAQLRVVVTHQPVAVPDTHELKHIIRGADAALRAWSAAGADILLGGHIHLPYVINVANRTGAARRMWCVQAGTAVSHRIRSGIPNSINLIRYSREHPRRCCVERWDYDLDRDSFRRHTVDTLARDP
jgi:3',5'-cyclic AMP phosphodiesterase CpdA